MKYAQVKMKIPVYRHLNFTNVTAQDTVLDHREQRRKCKIKTRLKGT